MGHNSGSSYKFPHLYRKRGGDRDVSARATHLKAATGIVLVTTIERKQMSNKTSFKRIALAVVASVGLGVLATGPSNATVQAGSTLSISATTASLVAGSGETATVTLTGTFTSVTGPDSMIITPVQTVGAASGFGTAAFRALTQGAPAADSSNATSLEILSAVGYVHAVPNKAVSGTFRWDVKSPTVAGTYAWTFYPTFNAALASGAVAPAPVTFTLTVTAANTKPAAAQSTVRIIGKAANVPGETISATITPNRADSTIAVSAGTLGAAASTFESVATLSWIQRNSDSSVASGILVKESVTAVISGAGLLSVENGGARANAVTAGADETIYVWSDGRGGTATITLTTTTMTTWATKTLTFFGTAKSASLSAVVGKVSKTGIDSATALRVVLKDASSSVVAGTATNMYIHSSDTKVVTNGLCSVTVSATTGFGNCSLSGRVADSGTTKIKVANYAYESISTHAALTTSYVSPEEVTIQVVGAPSKVKATFDKSTYNPGDEATVTLTFTDGLGNTVDSHTTLAGALAAGGLDYSSGGDVTDTIITFGAGVKTYTYQMPNTGQKVTLSYTGGAGLAGTQTADSVTVTVVDPAEEAANSALDAAQEATDAAIAATDAAVLAQESADAAAVAAEAAAETAAEAADAAKAAVDAVTKLSAEVTKLLTQFATLQKLMTRIAKKVGVKV
jgi:trimeric autotransporter adhesin